LSKLQLVLKLFAIEVAIVVKASRYRSCNLLSKPQTTMLKAHHEDRHTFEIQSSQLVQSSQPTQASQSSQLVQSSQPTRSSKHTFLNPMTFTNYFRSKPFLQIGFVSNLLKKFVELWMFLAKNTHINRDTHIVKKKRQDT
jgi:hypothetical protein